MFCLRITFFFVIAAGNYIKVFLKYFLIEKFIFFILNKNMVFKLSYSKEIIFRFKKVFINMSFFLIFIIKVD